jgi:2-C-methyl-D-erythritol 4-phosphate cytidylyltransferase/2-C-methyl-D-erythritol 2,4-cyclodiphosphate synthase
MKSSIILVAAGSGSRFGQAKWSVDLLGKTLLERNLELFTRLAFEHEVIIVAPESDLDEIKGLDIAKGAFIVPGGSQRNESVKIGLENASGESVLIHNVANPLADEQDFFVLHHWIEKRDGAAFVGQPVVDTLRRVGEHSTQTIDRTDMWRVQTPQAFRRATLLQLLNENQDPDVTDEVQLYEKESMSVAAFESSEMNHKITYKPDLSWAEALLTKETLVGLGEDSHAFDTTGTMKLAGVAIEGIPKLKGNSDGDVILHALYNAFSSALGGRSLGPTADPMAEQGILDSAEYLDVVLKKCKEAGFRPFQISISLECARPKIEPLVEELKDHLSNLLSIPPGKIGITATTGEELSSFGKGEGIRCHAVVSLIRIV